MFSLISKWPVFLQWVAGKTWTIREHGEFLEIQLTCLVLSENFTANWHLFGERECWPPGCMLPVTCKHCLLFLGVTGEESVFGTYWHQYIVTTWDGADVSLKVTLSHPRRCGSTWQELLWGGNVPCTTRKGSLGSSAIRPDSTLRHQGWLGFLYPGVGTQPLRGRSSYIIFRS